MLQGLHFVWHRKTVLGAISLDLFEVLFGGATALLPAYTRDVLHAGPEVFGYLRAAPGIGAGAMAIWLAFRPVSRHVGVTMFAGVAAFGMATLVLGLTHVFWVAMIALVVLGAGDMISVFVRSLLVQLQTPDEIRGRVSAVSAVFIGASNELGEFESGTTAAWFGLVPAIVIGGVATIVVTVLWARVFFLGCGACRHSSIKGIRTRWNIKTITRDAIMITLIITRMNTAMIMDTRLGMPTACRLKASTFEWASPWRSIWSSWSLRADSDFCPTRWR